MTRHPKGTSARATVRRVAKRGSYDRQVIEEILGEALVCHVGFVDGTAPVVIPMACWLWDGKFWVHGSKLTRAAKVLAGGAEACVTVTHLDGIVYARSAFHHSMNYRSVVLFGRPEKVEEPARKEAALKALIEHIAPGRWDKLRPMTRKEMNATSVFGFDLDEASAKLRTGPPIDDADDYALPLWAGVLPLALKPGRAVDDPSLTVDAAPAERFLPNLKKRR